SASPRTSMRADSDRRRRARDLPFSPLVLFGLVRLNPATSEAYDPDRGVAMILRPIIVRWSIRLKPRSHSSRASHKFVPLCRQGFSGVCPAIRMGQVFVVVRDVRENAARQVGLGDEIAAAKHAFLQDTKPDLNLVQPTAMLGRVMDHVLVLGI